MTVDWHPTATLSQARAWLNNRLFEGAHCPCCGQWSKLYQRSVHSTMAKALITLWRHSGQDWVHLSSVAGSACEAGKARYWGLIEEEVARRPDGGRSGWWRITPRGEAFVRGKLRIPRYALVHNGECRGHTGREVDIRDCLNTKFSYAALMAGDFPQQ